MMLRIRSRRNGIVGVMLLGLVMASAVFLLRGQGRVEAMTADWMQGEPALVDERPLGMFDGDEWSRSDCATRWVIVVGHYNYNRGKQERKRLCTSDIPGYELGQSGLEVYVRPHGHEIFYLLRNVGYMIHLHGTDTAFIGHGQYRFGRGVTHHVMKITDMSQRIVAYSDGVSYNLRTDNPAYRLVDAKGERAFAYGWGISNDGRYLAYADDGGSYGRFGRLSLIDTETGKQKMFGRGYYIDEYSYEPFPEFVISNDGTKIIAGGNGAFKMWRITEDCQVDRDAYIQSGRTDDPCPSRRLYPKVHSLMGKAGNTQTHRMKITDDCTKLSYYLDGVHPEGRRVVTLSAPNYYPHGQLDYLAMGDSYSSGEGDIWGDDFDAYTKGTGERKGCHLSYRSYPYYLAKWWQIPEERFQSVACSGAKIDPDYRADFGGYDGQNEVRREEISRVGKKKMIDDTLKEFLPGYIPQMEFIKRHKPKTITLTGGGNDAGFIDLLFQCIAPGTCAYAGDPEHIGLAMDVIYNQYANMKQFISLAQRYSPDSNIIIVGYPQFIAEEEGDYSGTLFLNKKERVMIRLYVTLMNQVLRHAARDMEVSFVDIENVLEGGMMCQGSKYITTTQDLKIYRIAGNDIHGAFHPNFVGHYKIAKSIRERLPKNDSQSLQPLPLPTRMVRWVAMISAMAKDYARRIPVSVPAGSFAPRSSVEVSLMSRKLSLGTQNTDDGGGVSFDINASQPIEPGHHTLVIEGVDRSGGQVVLLQSLYFRQGNNQGVSQMSGEKNLCEILPFIPDKAGKDMCKQGQLLHLAGSSQREWLYADRHDRAPRASAYRSGADDTDVLAKSGMDISPVGIVGIGVITLGFVLLWRYGGRYGQQKG